MICLGTGVASPTFWNLGRQDVLYLKHKPDGARLRGSER